MEIHMRIYYIAATISFLLIANAHADTVDDVITAEMKRRNIPGLSLAIIDGGKIVKTRGYGVTEKGGKVAVTASTLFQAASISKPVTAVGALHLVEQGKLTLDADVNTKLTSWKVPDNAFTQDKKVTVRGILSHTAGLSVSGFPGYTSSAPKPTLLQVLNGEAPANTAPVRVETIPGSVWNYSGGGYTVLQQLIVDVTGQPFPDFMRDTVLTPSGMNDSAYAQPLPVNKIPLAATGHYSNRDAVVGRAHTYPEMAAAGLWTTPSDLARFVIGVQQSLAGTSNPIISAAMTREMLTAQKNTGLGFFLDGTGKRQKFSHSGRNEGFDTFMSATAETGRGAIIMINTNDNSKMLTRMMMSIAKSYKWLEAVTDAANDPKPIKASAVALMRFSGRYELGNGATLALSQEKGQLWKMTDGLPDEVYVPIAPTRFYSPSSREQLAFTADDTGFASSVVLKSEGEAQNAVRIGPLMHALTKRADPAPARTEKLKAAIQACAQGGDKMTSSTLFAAGIKSALGTQPVPQCAGTKALVFLHEQDVSERAIQRHGSKVSKILSYRLKVFDRPTFLLVCLDADGLIADFSLVDD